MDKKLTYLSLNWDFLSSSLLLTLCIPHFIAIFCIDQSIKGKRVRRPLTGRTVPLPEEPSPHRRTVPTANRMVKWCESSPYRKNRPHRQPNGKKVRTVPSSENRPLIGRTVPSSEELSPHRRTVPVLHLLHPYVQSPPPEIE